MREGPGADALPTPDSSFPGIRYFVILACAFRDGTERVAGPKVKRLQRHMVVGMAAIYDSSTCVSMEYASWPHHT